MTTKQRLSNFLDSQDFYEPMQAYRHTPLDAAKEYEAVRVALIAAIAQPEQRPKFIHSAMGDLVFDGDDGYDEMLESQSLAQPKQPTSDLEASVQNINRLVLGGHADETDLLAIRIELAKVAQPEQLEGDAKDAPLNAEEIYEILSALDDHNGDDFEPECPGCTAYKKLAAIASQKATQ